MATATSAAGPHLQVAVSGQLAEDANKQSIGGTGLGVLLALVVLLVIFGSVFAAVLPIVSALFALGTAIGIVGMLSHVLKMPVFSPSWSSSSGWGSASTMPCSSSPDTARDWSRVGTPRARSSTP